MIGDVVIVEDRVYAIRREKWSPKNPFELRAFQRYLREWCWADPELFIVVRGVHPYATVQPHWTMGTYCNHRTYVSYRAAAAALRKWLAEYPDYLGGCIVQRIM